MTFATQLPPAVPYPDILAGPGWYESSWDLLCGLDVREVAFADGCYADAGGGELEPPSAT